MKLSKRVTINLTELEHTQLVELATKRGVSVAFLCAERIRRYLIAQNEVFSTSDDIPLSKRRFR